MWLLYMTIGNISTEVHSKSSQQAVVLFGLLPPPIKMAKLTAVERRDCQMCNQRCYKAYLPTFYVVSLQLRAVFTTLCVWMAIIDIDIHRCPPESLTILNTQICCNFVTVIVFGAKLRIRRLAIFLNVWLHFGMMHYTRGCSWSAMTKNLRVAAWFLLEIHCGQLMPVLAIFQNRTLCTACSSEFLNKC
jgi:hypothetical protein